MSKAIDLTGRRYTRLVALRQVWRENDKKHAFWECQCDCGNKFVARKDSLENGFAKSCGCLSAENGFHKHGYAYTRLYGIYQNIKDRCYNTNNHSYHLYGGRGIKMCDEWLNNPQTFFDWSYQNGYVEGKSRKEQSIDRKDVNGNYEPSNCRWVNQTVQNYNKQDTIRVLVNGEEKTLLDLHTEYSVPLTTLRSRYQRFKKGLCTIDELIQAEKIINKPQQIIIEVNGEKHNLTEWEKITGVSRKTIAHRYNRGKRTYDELFKKGR